MNLGATIIKSRRSVRSYTEAGLSDEIIREVLDCAHLAPTAMNIQPWLFGVITNRDLLSKIAAITDHGSFISEAAACFAVFGDKEAKYYLEDCCAATMNIIICLQGYGVGTCWVAGDKKEYAPRICELLHVPGKYSLVSLIPAGYPKKVEIPKKKTVQDISFFDEWSEPNKK